MKKRKLFAALTTVLLSASLAFAQTDVTTTTKGTSNYIPKFTDTINIENSSIFDNGNVGIGTTSPFAKFEVNNGSVLFQGTTGSTPVSGAGTRMMWIPDKKAFRAGYVDGAHWDADSIGWGSFAVGYNTKAKGSSSAAFGSSTKAEGYSAAFGENTTASDHSVAFGKNTNASAPYSAAFGISTTASGWYSVAFGENTVASGAHSAAFGISTTASGFESAAFGGGSISSGDFSIVSGWYPTASGYAASAFGWYTTAQALGSFVIGKYNVIAGSQLSWVDTDPLFVIGNGADNDNRANAMTVLKNGKVGIGTTDPAYLLDVNDTAQVATLRIPTGATNGYVLTSDASGNASWQAQSNDGDWTVLGSDICAAVSGNVGIGTPNPLHALHISKDYSNATGTDGNFIDIQNTNSAFEVMSGIRFWNGMTATTFKGAIFYQDKLGYGRGDMIFANNSVNAAGNVTTADARMIIKNDGSILFNGGAGIAPASGAGTRTMWIPGKAAFRSGNVTGTQWDDANIGSYSFAAGDDVEASGDYATAFGGSTVASGDYSLALGERSRAVGHNATAFGGGGTYASGDFSTSFGYSTIASGDYATAYGYITTAQAYVSTAIGRYNVVAGTTDSWVDTDPLFVIGNGASDVSRSNAMTVLKNGNVEINGDVTVNGSGTYTGTWTQSDKRYKNKIQTISSALDKVKSLRGTSFEFRTMEFNDKNFTEGTQYGFIAQELEQVLPELVKQDNDGYYAVNYDGVIPVLTEAIKEQQSIIEEQNKRIEKLEKMLKPKSLMNINDNVLGDDNAKLYQNTPNPFNQQTEINFYLADNVSNAAMLIFDMNGKQIKRYDLATRGNDKVIIHGSEMAPGMYMYSLIADGQLVDTKRMILTQ